MKDNLGYLDPLRKTMEDIARRDKEFEQWSRESLKELSKPPVQRWFESLMEQIRKVEDGCGDGEVVRVVVFLPHGAQLDVHSIGYTGKEMLTLHGETTGPTHVRHTVILHYSQLVLDVTQQRQVEEQKKERIGFYFE